MNIDIHIYQMSGWLYSTGISYVYWHCLLPNKEKATLREAKQTIYLMWIDVKEETVLRLKLLKINVEVLVEILYDEIIRKGTSIYTFHFFTWVPLQRNKTQNCFILIAVRWCLNTDIKLYSSNSMS